jgi:hypothetical protein
MDQENIGEPSCTRTTNQIKVLTWEWHLWQLLDILNSLQNFA